MNRSNPAEIVRRDRFLEEERERVGKGVLGDIEVAKEGEELMLQRLVVVVVVRGKGLFGCTEWNFWAEIRR